MYTLYIYLNKHTEHIVYLYIFYIISFLIDKPFYERVINLLMLFSNL